MADNVVGRRTIVSVLPVPTGTAGGPVDFNATGDKFILTPAVPTDIVRFGAILDSAQDPDAGGFVLALDHRPTAGSDTDRTEEATITRANADVSAAGDVLYNNVNAAVAQATAVDGSLVDSPSEGPLRVNPGEEAVIEVTNANGAASTGYVFLEVIEYGFDIGLDNVTEVTS